MSDDFCKSLLDRIEKIETLTFEPTEYLLVGIARCAWHEHQQIGEALDSALKDFKRRIIVYPSDELEFKKVRTK